MNKVLLFPRQPHVKNTVHVSFEKEYAAAKLIGFDCQLVQEDRVYDAPASVSMGLPMYDYNNTNGIYRGWIIQSGYYDAFKFAVKTKGIQLINTTNEYKNAQWLANSYSWFHQYMIDSVFIEKPTKKLLKLASRQLNSEKLFVKDYVKSEYGLTTINVSDLDGGMEILKQLEKERGKLFEGGFAIREFIELSSIEYRLWVLNGKVLNLDWEKIPSDIPTGLMYKIQKFPSNFYTIDLGRQKSDGQLVVVETNDGQVSGLKGLDPKVFYKSLKNNWE